MAMEYIDTKSIRRMLDRAFDVQDEINYLLEGYQFKSKLTEKDKIELKLLEHLRNVANRGLSEAYKEKRREA